MMPPRRPWRNQAGIGVVTALIAATVIGIMLAGLTLLVQNRTKERRIQTAADGRRLAWETLMSNAGSPDALMVSMYQAGNLALRNCVLADGVTCTQTNGAAPTTFNLWAPMKNGTNVQLTAATEGVAAGHFTYRGMHANLAATPFIPYWGRARFFATCPQFSSGGSCDQASRIYVVVDVAKISTIPNPGGIPGLNMNLGPYPRAGDIAAATGPTTRDKTRLVARTFSTDILRVAVQQCPKFSYMFGVDPDGIIQCRCEQGFYQSGTWAGSRFPVCTPIGACPQGTIMAGMDANGNATCRVPPPTTTQCWFSGPVNSSGNVSCPGVAHDSWRMRKLQIASECEVNGADKVVCPDLQIVCCREI